MNAHKSGIRMQVPYFQTPNSIFEAGLNEHELVTYVYLARCGNHGGQAFPSYKDIADKCGISRSTAIRSVKSLEEKGLLSKQVRRNGACSNQSNIYFLNAPAVVPAAAMQDTPEVPTTPYVDVAKSGMSPAETARNKAADKAISTYLRSLYRQKTGHRHPRLKAEQYRRVYDVISGFMDEMGLECKEMTTLMCQFLNSNIDSDWNINHFATEGMLVNRLYEVVL